MLWCLFLISFDSFGYPDPTYLVRVTEELREKGITAEWRQRNNEKKKKKRDSFRTLLDFPCVMPVLQRMSEDKALLRLMFNAAAAPRSLRSWFLCSFSIQSSDETSSTCVRKYSGCRALLYHIVEGCYNLRSYSKIWRHFMFYWSFLISGFFFCLKNGFYVFPNLAINSQRWGLYRLCFNFFFFFFSNEIIAIWSTHRHFGQCYSVRPLSWSWSKPVRVAIAVSLVATHWCQWHKSSFTCDLRVLPVCTEISRMLNFVSTFFPPSSESHLTRFMMSNQKGIQST